MVKKIQTLNDILCAAAARRRVIPVVSTAKAQSEAAERCTRQELADTFADVLTTGTTHPDPAADGSTPQTDRSD